MWFPLESYDPTSAPQTGDVLSDRFQQALPGCVGLWLPSLDDRGKALDFNPTPSKNLGALNGGITTVPGGFGMLGQAWNFNGSQYIQGSGNLGISGDAEFTISALISASNVSATATVFALLAASGGVGLDAALVIGGNGTGSINVWFGTDGVTTSTGIISAGTTYLLTATKTPGLPSTTTKVYVNSLSQSVSAQFGNSNPNITATRWNIGAGWWNSNTSQRFSGNIYKVTVFSKALTAPQVSLLYNCLLTGEPFPLFAPQTTELFAGSGAAVAGGPWPWFFDEMSGGMQTLGMCA